MTLLYMGYRYSIWLIPYIWEDIKKVYKTSHIPHIIIKTFLSLEQAQDIVNKYDNEYKIRFKDNIYDFNNIIYDPNKKDELPACGFLCNITGLELEHQPHMTLDYKYNHKVIPMESPEDLFGFISIVNTVSNIPEKWFFI